MHNNCREHVGSMSDDASIVAFQQPLVIVYRVQDFCFHLEKRMLYIVTVLYTQIVIIKFNAPEGTHMCL